MSRKEYIYNFQTETPSEYVARERKAGESALGLMTGGASQDVVIALLKKNSQAARQALEFEEEVSRLLVSELNPEEYSEFVASLLWEATGGISGEEFITQVESIQERIKNGELQDFEVVLKLHRDKIRKNHPDFILD